jgi:nucleosome binding factor SPN SPT16 subunit
MNRTKIFLKDVTYAVRDEGSVSEFVRSVREIQMEIKGKDQEMKNRLGLARQDALKLIPMAKKLPNVKVRPPPITGKHGCQGNLEIHENGFRFSYISGVPIELLFENIKHMIYQPAAGSISCIFHVTLRSPIMVGKRKTEELSFYAEVMEASEEVSSVRRTKEQEEEEGERDAERVVATNREFALFAIAVEKQSGRKVELPQSQNTWRGVPFRTMTTIKGSNRVLWALNDLPAFTLSVSDVEVVALERVIDGGSTFDITFVLKNYKTVPITTVPREHLGAVKDWCLSCRLYYIETTVNMMWTNILKEIQSTPGWEPYGEEGWCQVAGDEDEESEDDDDSTFEESSEESDDSVDDDDDSDAFEFAEDSDASTDSGGSDDSAKSWSSLERDAESEDAERDISGDDDDEDSDRPRKKRRVQVQPPKPNGAPSKAPGKVQVKSTPKMPQPQLVRAPAPKVGLKGAAAPFRRL